MTGALVDQYQVLVTAEEGGPRPFYVWASSYERATHCALLHMTLIRESLSEDDGESDSEEPDDDA